ncbi:unnamed protein product [Vitrella brassicaformis CCMP3155]|uniref:Iron-sulfur cluster assembly protein n=1 Tax=Vitrella brassicaformis (strain CCMP3155) TaxID=1169540 RepID=A0A0G4G182_VITBC|nr:unnamed protein product [Vitrella brassicaformis CCMP3155]|eukprot:CEM21748.1 unnamed protein product [Vitrella brassicaformis CCMP3155]
MAGAVRRYSENVHEHFQHPRNVGSFKKGEEHVGTAIVGKAACGDVIKLQVKIEEGVIKDAKFKTFGCGSAIASSSYATELIKGKTPEEAMQLKNTDIADYLKLPPVKIHCSLLAEDAVRHAIEDYQKKYPGVTEATIAADEGPTSHQQQMGAA